MRWLLSRQAQRGQAIVLIAAMMTVLLGFVALAIDSARAFETRRLLQDSVDAAALYAADSYSSGSNWNTAVLNGANLFAQDLHLYGGASCATATAPTLGSPTAVSISCSVPSPATLAVYVSDEGPAGQAFTYSASYPMTVAIMQVLGISPNVTVTAQATAVTGDQAWSPALALISTAGCNGSAGSALTVTSSNPVQVFGNVFTDGAASVDVSSALQLAGNYNGACSVSSPTAPAYECWPSTPPTTASPPCPAGSVATSGLNPQLTSHFSDPGYAAPSTGSLSSQVWPGCASATNCGAVAQPGIYNSAVTVQALAGNTYPCYFMAAGVYDFAAGLNVNNGLLSNRLSAPDPRIHHGQQSTYPLWDDNKNAHCTGSVAINAPTISACSPTPCVPIANWGFEITSYRYDTYNGVTYYRESPPGACHQPPSPVTLPNQDIPLVISNQPGAQGYNVYAVLNPSACSPTSTPPTNNNFGFVASIPIDATHSSNCPGGQGVPNYCQSNATTSGCPSTSNPQSSTCTLGEVTATIDGSCLSVSGWPKTTAARQTCGGPMPDDLGSIYESGYGLPSQDSPRGNPQASYAADTWGDLANPNFCATPSTTSGIKCPAGWASGYVTPGAVQLYFPNNFCLNQTATADMYVFGGYQYNWLTVYEPATTTCGNSLGGTFFSGVIGAIYAPGAGLTISGAQRYSGDPASLNRSLLTPWLGGIVVKTCTISSAPNLAIPYNGSYAPPIGGNRLTG